MGGRPPNATAASASGTPTVLTAAPALPPSAPAPAHQPVQPVVAQPAY
uniref:Uncharacterized protein n=1 Tax=Globisporangium ultimum (strain ATCC 200006 / CBS 805.95 / DAOM BR144) TaxID=431595 RepID=K3X8P1_GLOUD